MLVGRFGSVMGLSKNCRPHKKEKKEEEGRTRKKKKKNIGVAEE